MKVFQNGADSGNYLSADEDASRPQRHDLLARRRFKGIVYFPIRLLLGAYDLVTFLIPYPKSYGYWVEPETLIEGFNGLKYKDK